jgi:hypothetical protein
MAVFFGNGDACHIHELDNVARGGAECRKDVAR